MALDRPKHWAKFLGWAKFFYNSHFNNSIGMSPYQALYGNLSPHIIPYALGSSSNSVLDDMLLTVKYYFGL